MIAEVALTVGGADELHGVLVNIEVGPRGELALTAHDTVGSVTGMLTVAPGEWRSARWKDVPLAEDVAAYRQFTQQHNDHHGSNSHL